MGILTALRELEGRIKERRLERLESEAETLDNKASALREVERPQAARRREEEAARLRYLAERVRLLESGHE